MLLLDLFDTRSASTAAVRRNADLSKPVDRDIGMERFTPLPDPVPAEVLAAGLATSDLSQ
jgi:hypothetical protein